MQLQYPQTNINFEIKQSTPIYNTKKNITQRFETPIPITQLKFTNSPVLHTPKRYPSTQNKIAKAIQDNTPG